MSAARWRQQLHRDSKPRTRALLDVLRSSLGVLVCSAAAALAAEPPATKSAEPPPGVETFDTAQQAGAALIDAAATFDETRLTNLVGQSGRDVILTGDREHDRQRAADFTAQAAEKNRVEVDPKSGTRATVFVGDEDWPFPVPVVKRGGKWFFDAVAGRRELVYRRIGDNELDAIDVCHGYVEAQDEYALTKREGSAVNEYAQRIIARPGKQDGLAWQNADGSWGGPVGEHIARAIEQGYTPGAEPYHGYFFKILKGQGPAARLGRMDYVINGVMIGGFALVAAPAVYGVTGINTFMVSYDGVVYEKDFGAQTSEQFQTMELFDPDKSWDVVRDSD
jgi:Protein of unknown function (DUF2950)